MKLFSKPFLNLSLVVTFSLLAGQDAQGQGVLARSEIATIQLIDNVKVASRDAGIIIEVLVKPGDRVKKGQPLVRLDRALNEAELAASQADLQIATLQAQNDIDLRYANKSTEVVAKTLERLKKAKASYDKSISQTEIDQSALEYQRSILSAEQATAATQIAEQTKGLREQQMKAATLRLEFREILAPIDGEVAEVFAQVGEAVAAGEMTVRVINMDRLRIVAEMEPQMIFALKTDQDCQFVLAPQFTVESEPRGIQTKLSFVSQEFDPISRRFQVYAEFDNKDRLFKPGLVGQLTIPK